MDLAVQMDQQAVAESAVAQPCWRGVSRGSLGSCIAAKAVLMQSVEETGAVAGTGAVEMTVVLVVSVDLFSVTTVAVGRIVVVVAENQKQ